MAPKAQAESMVEDVARHGEWIRGHEIRCEERYAGIQRSIEDMHGVLNGVQGTLRGAAKIGLGVLLSMIAWLGVQVWNGSRADAAVDRARIAALEHAPTAPAVAMVLQPKP